MELLALSSPLLADIQVGVMARSLGAALVVVAPFWFLRRRKRRATSDTDPSMGAPNTDAATAPSLEALIEEISALGATGVDPAQAGGDQGHTGGAVTVRVPHGLTIDGEAAPLAVVDAIVRDALARSGLVPTAELDTGSARLIECRRRAASGQRTD